MLVLSCISLLPGCITVTRAVVYNVPSIRDIDHFPSDTIPASDIAEFPFTVIENSPSNLPPVKLWTAHQKKSYNTGINSFLKETNSVSFIAIRNDSVLYEQYANDNTADRPNIIFSITKIFITSLLAIAIEEGHIQNLDQKVKEFLPYFDKGQKADISLRHLLQMTSGLRFDDYRKLAKTARTYYNNDLVRLVKVAKLSHTPGEHFTYKSIDTQILGLCIEAATNKRMSDYLYEKIWQPLGMEYPAYFTLDRKGGNARMYGGLAACSRDLVKLGKLYLNEGNWNGKQIIPKAWVQSTPTRHENENKWWGYNKGWWLETFFDQHYMDKEDYYAAGYYGQSMYLDPEQNIIILRQGLNYGDIRWSTALGHLAKLLHTQPSTKPPTVVDVCEQQDKFSGKYIAEDGQILELATTDEKGRNWKVLRWHKKQQQNKQEMEYEIGSPLSIINLKELMSIMFEAKGQNVTGLYLDNNISELRYFKKAE